MDNYTVRICLFYALFATVFATIPSYIKVCHRNDPDINRCIVKSIEELRKKLSNGIPELEVPSLEPFILKHLQISSGPKNWRFDVNIMNVEVFGNSKFVIRDLHVDTENLIFNFNVTIDVVQAVGTYKLNTQFSLLRMTGSGNFTGQFDCFGYHVKMKGHKIHKNNETYIEFEKIKLNINVRRTKLNFESLFNDNPVLRPVLNDLINENSDLFFMEIKPTLELSLSELLTDIANKIVQGFTYNALFPN